MLMLNDAQTDLLFTFWVYMNPGGKTALVAGHEIVVKYCYQHSFCIGCKCLPDLFVSFNFIEGITQNNLAEESYINHKNLYGLLTYPINFYITYKSK